MYHARHKYSNAMPLYNHNYLFQICSSLHKFTGLSIEDILVTEGTNTKILSYKYIWHCKYCKYYEFNTISMWHLLCYKYFVANYIGLCLEYLTRCFCNLDFLRQWTQTGNDSCKWPLFASTSFNKWSKPCIANYTWAFS